MIAVNFQPMYVCTMQLEKFQYEDNDILSIFNQTDLKHFIVNSI